MSIIKKYLGKFLLLLLFSCFVSGQLKAESAAGPAGLSFNKKDRILVLAPHPDDEVLGTGGVIQQAREQNIPVRVAFLTYGDNNQWAFMLYRKRPVIFPTEVRGMGEVRRGEAIKADKVLGVSKDNLIFLGYPDYRTLEIWCKHWGKSGPARSMLTRVKKVPYADAYRPGAPYKGEDVVRDLKSVIAEFKPTIIFMSHPADYNMDHRALYLFTTIALWDLAKELQPVQYPYLVHYKHWPEPKGYHPEDKLRFPEIMGKELSCSVYELTAAEKQLKDAALKDHATQYRARPDLLLSFIRENELFGDFPVIRLARGAEDKVPGAKIETNDDSMPEWVTHEERKLFFGIRERSFRSSNDTLVLSLKLSRLLAKDMKIYVYFFGYRDDKPFAEMPKIRIKIDKNGHLVHDQGERIAKDTVKISRKGNKITIRVSYKNLGSPQKILTSARTYLGNASLDWTSWRILVCE